MNVINVVYWSAQITRCMLFGTIRGWERLWGREIYCKEDEERVCRLEGERARLHVFWGPALSNTTRLTSRQREVLMTSAFQFCRLVMTYLSHFCLRE